METGKILTLDDARVPVADYWQVRKKIEAAAKAGDDLLLIKLSKEYPKVFKAVLQEAKSGIRKRAPQ